MQQVNWFLTLKTEQEWSSGKGTCFPSPGEEGTGTFYNGLYGEAPIKRGTFFMLQVYKMVLACCWFSASPRGFSLGSPIFPSLQKQTFPNSNSTQDTRTRISCQQLLNAPWENKLQITSIFVYFFRLIPWLRQN